MKNKIFGILILSLVLCLSAIGVCASTSDALNNLYYLKAYGNQFPNFNSPYNIVEGEGVVNEATGALCTNVEDYIIEGKNDFDVPITRSMNTLITGGEVDQEILDRERQTVKYYYMDYICSADDEVISVRFYNEQQMYEADPSFEGVMHRGADKTYWYRDMKREDTGIFYTLADTSAHPSHQYTQSDLQESLYSIATTRAFVKLDSGMQISKPAIIRYDVIDYDMEREVYILFQDLQAQTHALCLDFDRDYNPDRFLKSYKPDGVTYSKYDVTFVNKNDINETTTHPLGFEYHLTLTSDDGFKYYVYFTPFFSFEIIYAEDRYGNGYTIGDIDSGYSITTDTGVIYNVTMDGITKEYNNQTTELVSYTSKVINSDKDIYDKYEIDDEYIFTVTKNSGTGAQISETEENSTRYYINKKLRYEYPLQQWKVCAYKLPYKIETPNGLTKHIEYETSLPWIVSSCDSVGYVDGNYYPVTQYYEVDAHGNIKNESTFIYETDTDKEHYIYLSNMTRTDLSNGVPQKYTDFVIDRDSRITKKTVKKNSRTYDEYEYTYLYANADSPVRAINVEYYVDNYLKADDGMSYDYLSGYYPTREVHGNYDVKYTYFTDGNYIPSVITYTKDSSTSVKIKNTLTEDKKSVASTTVYENDTPVKTTEYTYDTYGNVATEKVIMNDEQYILTSYSYDYGPDGSYTLTTRISNVKDADGNDLADIVTLHSYDADHNLIAQIDANGNSTVMTYDHTGRLLATQYPDGTSDSYTYDISDCVTTYTAPNGTVYKAYFDAWDNIIKTTVVIDGTETTLNSYEYDDRCNVSSYRRYVSADDYTEARYTYDYLDRPVSENVYDSLGTLIKSTEIAYTLSGGTGNRPLNTVTATVTNTTGEQASYSTTTNYRDYVTETKMFTDTEQRVNTFAHDYLGNVITSTDAMGNVTSSVYDALGNAISVTHPDGSVTSTEYNGAGLVSSQTDALGNRINYIYDNAGRLIKTDAPLDIDNRAVTKTYYAPNGNVISTKVLSSRADDKETYTVTDYTYDNMNRVTDVTVHPSETNEIHTRYEYDASGNPVKTVSGLVSSSAPESSGQVVTYQYDTLGRMISTTTPDGKTQSAQYDLQGRLINSVDKSGRSTAFVYDAFDNILSKSSDNEQVYFTYDIKGNRISMTDSTGTVNYVYNAFGDLTTETKGDTLKSYTYDLLGRPLSFTLTTPDGIFETAYAYDTMGRLLNVSSDEDNISYTYDANSNLLTSARNGEVYSTTEYNGANLPSKTTLIDESGKANTLSYRYNPDGNLAMTMGTDISSMYYYDGANRLVYENTWGDNLDYTDRFTYDNFGNRTARRYDDYINNVSSDTNYTYNSINQLILKTDGQDTTIYSYDLNGNMTSVAVNGITEKVYSYDEFNRLRTANVDGNLSSYTYNGDNLRQNKTVNGITTSHVYDGSNVVADIGNSATYYVRGNGLALLKNDSGAYLYTLTPRGDVRKVYKSTSDVNDYIYTAYGESAGDNTYTVNPFGYTGEYTDNETGLIYLRNRYYDPSIGRFTSEDPHWNPYNMIYGDKEYEEGETKIPDTNAIKQSNNLYAYCMNNPKTYVDPSGKTVTGYGLTASISAVLGYEGQVLWVVDDKGNFALMTVNGAISSVGVSLGGILFTFPDMPTLDKMAGEGIGISMSIGSNGGNIIAAGDYTGVAYTASVGSEVDVQLSADLTYTYITPIRGNINSIGLWLKKLINAVLPKDLEIQ